MRFTPSVLLYMKSNAQKVGEHLEYSATVWKVHSICYFFRMFAICVFYISCNV